MDTIDKFIKRYSYKFPKGYPDLTQDEDKKILKEILSVDFNINMCSSDNKGISLTKENFLSLETLIPKI